MSLTPGSRLGSYEILAPVGAGGMGEVYEARDTRLQRTVAIKVLPEVFSQNKERLDRFEREARLLAALNHPNIAAIYDLEESEGVHFLVLEYVPGETLAERIRRSPIPVEETLPLFRQIAEALEAAHAKGIIHRDLKPSNIKVTPESKVKVLDFGLAKALAGEAPTQDLSESPTITRDATETGVLLGTAPYMSPEQARGKTADKRADIWAFGCCLYEALTGRATFLGETVSDTIARILEREPDWEALPRVTPASIRSLLRRCVRKDPERRWHDVADVRIEIEEALAESPKPHETPDVSGAAPWKRLFPVVAGSLVAALVMGLIVWNLKPPPQRAVSRLEIVPPMTHNDVGSYRHRVALSRDGSHLVYFANDQLYLRPMDRLEAIPIRGTESGYSPFFSPDGQWLGFWSGGHLKKVPIRGGTPVTLCEAKNPWGASWGTDDTIVFGQGPEGVFRVPAAGGTPEVLIALDSTKKEVALGPQILPGGKAVLFTLAAGGIWDEAEIVAQSLETGERRVLVEGGCDARFVPTGHVVYAVEYTLVAVPFDPARLEISGDPVTVGGPVVRTLMTGAVHFCFSDTGSLVYQTRAGAEIILVWVDREGRSTARMEVPRSIQYLRLSPDGRKLAVAVSKEKGVGRDIWIYDVERGTRSRLTVEGTNLNPIWTPDSKRITFASSHRGTVSINWMLADGSGEAEPLLPAEYPQFPSSWSPDGRILAFFELNPTTQNDIWVLKLDEDRTPSPLIATEFNEHSPRFSPDGRWLAYVSDESGRMEVYLQAYPISGGKRPVSIKGGREPVWSADGRVLFFRNGEQVLSVSVGTETELSIGTPRLVFQGRYRSYGDGINYDVSPDAQRFLMVTQESMPRRFIVVLNWFEELERLVPTR